MPLIRWLEEFSQDGIPIMSTMSSLNFPALVSKCIDIGLAVSLIAELGAELGGLEPLRSSPVPAAFGDQLVQLCVLLRLLSAGGDGDSGLPLCELQAVLESLWLSSSQHPQTELR